MAQNCPTRPAIFSIRALYLLFALSFSFLLIGPVSAKVIIQPETTSDWVIADGGMYQFLKNDIPGNVPLDNGIQSASVFMSCPDSRIIIINALSLAGDSQSDTLSVEALGWYDFDFVGNPNADDMPSIRALEVRGYGAVDIAGCSIYGTNYNSIGNDNAGSNAYDPGATTTLKDLAFSINLLQTGPADYIFISKPANLSTVSDFSDFSIYYRTDNTLAYINLYYDNGVDFRVESGLPLPATLGRVELIPKSFLLTNGTWNLTAKLMDLYAGELATMSSTFNINIVAGSGVATPSCEGGGWAGNAFCEVLVYLFVPDPAVFNAFGNVANSIKNKPPMGYFTAIVSDINKIGDAETPAFIIPYTAALAPFFTPIRAALIWIFWLLLGLWLFHRARNMDI